MSRKVREELKKLQSMKVNFEAEIVSLEITEKNLKKEISTKKSNLNELKQRMNNLSKICDGLTVSDHAIVRYMERVVGINIEDITNKILPSSVALAIENLGNCHYPVNNGEFKLIVKDGVVITIYTAESNKS